MSLSVFNVVLARFDGDVAVARRYCRDQAKHYRSLAKQYPNLRQLAEGYERASRSTDGVSNVRKKRRRKGVPRPAADPV